MNYLRWLFSYRRRKQLAAELDVPQEKLDRVLKRISAEMDTWE